MPKWTEHTLGDLLLTDFDGAWGDDANDHNGTIVLRSTDMRGGRLSFDNAARRSISESVITKKRLFDGDILVNKSSGSAHLVGASVLFNAPDDCTYLCSNFTRCLRPKPDVVNPEFLHYALQAPQFREQIFGAQRTTSGLRNLKISEYKEAQVRAPSLQEQDRVVKRINKCIARIEEVSCLSSSAKTELTELKRSLVMGQSINEHQWKPLSELVDWIQDSEKVEPDTEYRFAGIKSFGRGLFSRESKTTEDFAYTSLRRLRAGDFIYPKLMAWEGAFAMVTKEFDRMVVSPEFVVFRPKNGVICSEALDAYFRSPVCLQDVVRASTGSNRRRRRLNPRAFLTLEMPVPSQEKQEFLKAVYNFESDAEPSWRGSEEELRALRESILRKAFAGEL